MIQIKHWATGAVLFEHAGDGLRAAVETAVADGGSLDGASLDGANLIRASLNGASLDGASLDGASLDDASLNGASLNGASLNGASLNGASLDGARGIIDAGQRTDGYRFLGVLGPDGHLMIKAGCRWFIASRARAHWGGSDYPDRALGDESLARVALIVTLARARGWRVERDASGETA